MSDNKHWPTTDIWGCARNEAHNGERSSCLACALAESEARRATLEREANAYLGAIGGLKRERDDAEARRAEAERERERADKAHFHAIGEWDKAAARAEAAERSLAAAVEVLRQVEWGVLVVVLSDGSQAPCCPCCNNYKMHGHAHDCALASVLGGGR